MIHANRAGAQKKIGVSVADGSRESIRASRVANRPWR